MVVDINVNEKQKACSEGIHSYPQRVFATEWCTRTDTFIALPLGRCYFRSRYVIPMGVSYLECVEHNSVQDYHWRSDVKGFRPAPLAQVGT